MEPPEPGCFKHVAFSPIIELESERCAYGWTDLLVLTKSEQGVWSTAAAGRYYDTLIISKERREFAAGRKLGFYLAVGTGVFARVCVGVLVLMTRSSRGRMGYFPCGRRGRRTP